MRWLQSRVAGVVPARGGRREGATGSAVALVALAGLTAALVAVRPHLGLLNTGLLYLVLVALVAACWGWGPGLLASVVANLCLNFFFVPPLHRFTVAEAANVVALLVFLGVTALISGLLGRARAGEAAARRREQETAILYELSRLVIGEPNLAATLSTICRRVRETFTVESCAVLLPGSGGLVPVAWSGPGGAPVPASAYDRRAAEQALAGGTFVALDGRPGRRRPRIVGLAGSRAPLACVPLRVGAAAVGVLQVSGRIAARVFTPDDLRLLEAFADEAALAVDRNRLLHEAARAEALQEADRLRAALLSAVSHDLRTPLAAIKASVSSLLDPDVAWDAAARHELLTAIDEETDRLTRMVSNLLDLSRIEAGALRPETDRYDVGELIETVAGRMARAVAAHRLVLDVPADIGDASLDYVQIGQVLANLIENAAKFAPAGTTIRVAARRRVGEVEISVADEGPGVPPAERARVFEKFYRFEDAGRRVPGTGLGLAISKGLVEAHGGRIWIEEAPGGGARAVFTLPTGAARAAPPAVAAGA
jgi:two-component system sensor histidine kinase KdpD